MTNAEKFAAEQNAEVAKATAAAEKAAQAAEVAKLSAV